MFQVALLKRDLSHFLSCCELVDKETVLDFMIIAKEVSRKSNIRYTEKYFSYY